MTGQSNQRKDLNVPINFHSIDGRNKGGLGSSHSDDDDNDSDTEHVPMIQDSNCTSRRDASLPSSPIGVSSLLIPSLISLIRLTLGALVVLYILNQQHLLPRPVSKIVSHVLFWPTLPITVSKRLGKWYTPIDDTVIMGGAPFAFAKLPELLYEHYDVRTCNLL